MNAKRKVLVIDDDAVVGRSFDRVLSDKGYDVSTVLSGEDALSSIEHNDYDVVFTDIKMPGMDGLEVTERIKERCPWTPVVVITGYGTRENEAKASVLGVSGFVRKPLTPEMIESITLKAVNDSASERAAPVAQQAAAEVVAEAATVAMAPESEAQAKPVRNSRLKNVFLFFASPFIALGYVIALPFVGFYMFAKLAYEAYSKKQLPR
jgi:DNA-binding NtrC family response regulator